MYNNISTLSTAYTGRTSVPQCHHHNVSRPRLALHRWRPLLCWLGGPRSGPAQPLDIYITTQQLPTTLLRNLPPSGEITGDQGREGLRTNIERAELELKYARFGYHKWSWQVWLLNIFFYCRFFHPTADLKISTYCWYLNQKLLPCTNIHLPNFLMISLRPSWKTLPLTFLYLS